MAGASVLALSFGAEMAAAQELDVVKRPRPEYDAVGLRAGSFIIYPEMQVRGAYNDNIYAEENNETDDFITRLIPSVDARSDWNNHALNINAFVDAGIYADNSDEDFIDYGLTTDGRIDIQRNANLFGGLGYQHLHEDRGSPDDVDGADPTEYDRWNANLGGTYKPNRLGVTVEGTWINLDFDNVPRLGGGTVNNQDRDRNVYTQRLRVGYDVQPGYVAFIQGMLNQREYDTVPDDNGFNRDSDGWRTDVGMEIRLTGTLDAEVYVGYFSQSYDDPAFSDVDDVDFGGRLLWSATPRLTVRGGVVRDVVETTTINASSYVSSVADIGADYELLRNVLVGGSFSFTNNSYDGIDRDDDIWRIKADGKYLINRNFYAGGEVHYTDRDSNTVNNSYDQFVIGAFVGAQF